MAARTAISHKSRLLTVGYSHYTYRIMKETYQCMFCGNGIEPGALDPCALNLVAHIDRPRSEQKEQTFYCHFVCLRDKAAIHHGNFYITEPDHPTEGQESAA